MERKVNNTIPVYEICAINGDNREDDLLLIENLSEYLIVHPDMVKPHRHNFFHFVLFTGGSGYHTVDFERFCVKRGHMYFMCPGQVHSWEFDEGVDGYIVNFSGQLFESNQSTGSFLSRFSFLRSIASESNFECEGELYKDLCNLLVRLKNERLRDAKDEYTQAMYVALLTEILVTLHRSRETSTSIVAPPHSLLVLNNFRDLIDKYYRIMHLPKEYAAMLYITPNHLNALCKDLLGKPSGAIIRDRLLLEAKRLLVNGSFSISEIADYLNFSDNSHFTKFFKKEAGVTPEEFKKISIKK